jgi:hypothetical protein
MHEARKEGRKAERRLKKADSPQAKKKARKRLKFEVP